MMMPPLDGEGGAAYLGRIRELWNEKLGEDFLEDSRTKRLFRISIESSVTVTIKTELKGTVGLMDINLYDWEAQVRRHIDKNNQSREKMNLTKAEAKQMSQTSVQQTPAQTPGHYVPYNPYPAPPPNPYAPIYQQPQQAAFAPPQAQFHQPHVSQQAGQQPGQQPITGSPPYRWVIQRRRWWVRGNWGNGGVRHNNNNCFNRREAGHWANVCPYPPKG